MSVRSCVRSSASSPSHPWVTHAPGGPPVLGESRSYAFGFTNAAQAYANMWRKRMGSYLPGLKGEPWPLRLEEDPIQAVDLDDRSRAYEDATEPDPDSLGVGERMGHQPWRPCFMIIKAQVTPSGPRPPQANGGGPHPTPEQITARRQELEELR